MNSTNDRNLRLGFTTQLYLTNKDLGHANLRTQTTEVEWLQIEAHLRLPSKVDRLTKIILVIYFHETRIIKGTRLSNQKLPIKTLIVFHIRKINCSQSRYRQRIQLWLICQILIKNMNISLSGNSLNIWRTK